MQHHPWCRRISIKPKIQHKNHPWTKQCKLVLPLYCPNLLLLFIYFGLVFLSYIPAFICFILASLSFNLASLSCSLIFINFSWDLCSTLSPFNLQAVVPLPQSWQNSLPVHAHFKITPYEIITFHFWLLHNWTKRDRTLNPKLGEITKIIQN